MKKLPLHDSHLARGAKMVSFGGYEMPIHYGSLKEEHLAVRNGCGVFDVSHMGEFFISGPHALKLVQLVSSNDASKLVIGQAQYAYLPNEDGGIVDDFVIYRLSEEQYLMVVNASNIEKDWQWIQSKNKVGAKMENLSDNYCLLAVQGPKAVGLLQSLTEVSLADIKNYHFEIGRFAGVDDVIISATGYTGAGGFELYVKSDEVVKVWDQLFEIDQIAPAGLGARDLLRIEMGYCLYGNDINDKTSPLAAGLGWVTKFTKEFVNSSNLSKEKETGSKEKLVGFLMTEGGIPRQGYKVFSMDGEEIGKVTSGTQSPILSQGIGLGYVQKGYSKKDTLLNIQIRDKMKTAKVVRPPFI